MNVFEFGYVTSNEESSYNYAVALGLIPGIEPRCNFCGGKMHRDKSKIRHGFASMFRCNAKNCRKWESILKNTIFEEKNLKISQILRLMYCFALKLTVSEARIHTGCAKETITSWNNFFRQEIANKYDEIRLNKIGGQGFTVEIDEAHLYTNRRRIGRRLRGEQYWIVSGICRESGELFFAITTVRNSAYLTNLILNNVEIGTRLITDSWRGYNNLEANGYIHNRINHRREWVNVDDPTIHTNNIERVWRDLRDNIPSNISQNHLITHIKNYMMGRMYDSKNSISRFEMLVNILS